MRLRPRLVPVSQARSRQGPYHGFSQDHRLPNTPCARVMPVHNSVQIVSGKGLERGSRLPQNPAAMSAAKTAKESRLATAVQCPETGKEASARARDGPAPQATPGSIPGRMPPPQRRRRRGSSWSAEAGRGRDRKHAPMPARGEAGSHRPTQRAGPTDFVADSTACSSGKWQTGTRLA